MIKPNNKKKLKYGRIYNFEGKFLIIKNNANSFFFEPEYNWKNFIKLNYSINVVMQVFLCFYPRQKNFFIKLLPSYT